MNCNPAARPHICLSSDCGCGMTRRDFLRLSALTGAGLAVIFLAIVVALVGALITSQTLMAAVAGSRNEYATLNALGVGRAALSRVVLEQAGWIGVGGLLLGALLSALALALARSHAVPVEIHAGISALCALSVLIIALVSGLAALRTLRHSDPASLLR